MCHTASPLKPDSGRSRRADLLSGPAARDRARSEHGHVQPVTRRHGVDCAGDVDRRRPRLGPCDAPSPSMLPFCCARCTSGCRNRYMRPQRIIHRPRLCSAQARHRRPHYPTSASLPSAVHPPITVRITQPRSGLFLRSPASWLVGPPHSLPCYCPLAPVHHSASCLAINICDVLVEEGGPRVEAKRRGGDPVPRASCRAKFPERAGSSMCVWGVAVYRPP
jgi:hypothetical protein